MSKSSLDRKIIPSGKSIDGYQIVYIIGVGGFGGIYKVKEKKTNQMFAMKTESLNSNRGTLPNEIEYIKQLKGDLFPKFRSSGTSKKYNVNYLVMNLLGPSIGGIQAYHQRKLEKELVYNICYKMLGIIKSFHSYGYVHCDIKPSNFLIQQSRDSPLVLIDFGLCKKHIDPSTNEPFPFQKNQVFCGTKKFASINVHEGCLYGRRDDIISWFYSFIDLACGSLPWEKLQDNDEIVNSKKNLNLSELGEFPDQIELIYYYIKKLKYADEPDYIKIAHLFKQAMEDDGIHPGEIDWFSFYAAHSNLANLQKAMSLNMIKVLNSNNHDDISNKPFKKTNSTPSKHSRNYSKTENKSSKSRSHRHHKSHNDGNPKEHVSLPPVPNKDNDMNDNQKDINYQKKTEKSEQVHSQKKKKDSQIYDDGEKRERYLEEEEDLSDGKRCLIQ